MKCHASREFLILGSRSFVFPSRGRRDGGAFTLIELIVAMAVALVIVFVLLQVFSTSADSWQKGETQADTYREARAAMQIMSRDVRQIVPAPLASPTPTASPSPAPTPVTVAVAPSLIIDHYPAAANTSPAVPGDEINEELYCLTLAPNSGASAMCAVGYYCQWDTSKHAFVLMRQALNSNGTFQCFKEAHDRLPPAGPANPMTFLDLFTRPSPQATGPFVGPAPDELASFIWDLQFRVDKTLTFPVASKSEPALPPPDHSDPALYYGGQPPYPMQLPAYVEIRFKALSASAVNAFKNNNGVTRATWATPANSDTLDSFKRIIQKNSRQFVSRVPLLNGAATSKKP